MKKISVTILALSLAGCATVPQPKPTAIHKAVKAAPKYAEPCPCSPTANQVVKKRWFSGWKFLH